MHWNALECSINLYLQITDAAFIIFLVVGLYVNHKSATVAQSVEQLIRNQQVRGSSPLSSLQRELPSQLSLFFLLVQMFQVLNSLI